MPTPFPGMDPYLERPNLWSNVHNSLITAIRDVLAPMLRPATSWPCKNARILTSQGAWVLSTFLMPRWLARSRPNARAHA